MTVTIFYSPDLFIVHIFWYIQHYQWWFVIFITRLNIFSVQMTLETGLKRSLLPSSLHCLSNSLFLMFFINDEIRKMLRKGTSLDTALPLWRVWIDVTRWCPSFYKSFTALIELWLSNSQCSVNNKKLR